MTLQHGAIRWMERRIAVGWLLATTISALLLAFSSPVSRLVTAWYDIHHPVVSAWTVTSSEVHGADVTLRGTMIRQRNCLFVPPTIARDSTGQNYAVQSSSPTAGRSWGVSDAPQRWGPWVIPGGAGKPLTFANIYLCDEGRPKVVELGVYVPK